MLSIIKRNLKELGFSENEVKVYIALTQLGESTAAKIAKKADLPRTTVIGILNKLKDDNYLSAYYYNNSTYYWIESPKTIQNTLLNRANVAAELNDLLRDLYRTEADFPYAQICDSESGIKTFIEKTLINLEKKSTVYTIDTPSVGNYTKIFSDNFYDTLLDLKNKKGITTKTLIPYGSFVTINPKKIKGQIIILREMPREINFKASLWIIKDLLVLFSGRYPFVVAIRHKIITESIKTIFDYLWSVSATKTI